MVAEIYGGLSALKAAFDMAKGLKDIHDVTVRDRAIVELLEKLLAAQAAQSDLAQRIRELEQQIADFENWDAEKEKYELKAIGGGAFARMLKRDARGTEPPHWLCTRCYENRKAATGKNEPNSCVQLPRMRCHVRDKHWLHGEVDRLNQRGRSQVYASLRS